MRETPDQRQPEFRHLRIYAIDPMVSRAPEHQATVQIRFEKLKLWRGKSLSKKKDPVSLRGSRVEVVDLDAAAPMPIWFKPVNLDDANIAMQHGLEPSESDPQFHQQMVYAVAMRTLEQFDRALGRRVHFPRRRRLRLVPHAFRGSNAFYYPDMRAVLFGYFRASKDAPGDNLPGQLIFTCLSHDIVAHEVTHAIVDRLRPSFNVATNPHVRAFHEGFADIVAMFQRLSYRDLVQRALLDTQGDLLRGGGRGATGRDGSPVPRKTLRGTYARVSRRSTISRISRPNSGKGLEAVRLCALRSTARPRSRTFVRNMSLAPFSSRQFSRGFTGPTNDALRT